MGSGRERWEGKRGEGSGARGGELKATKSWPLEKSGPSITKNNKNKKTVAKERPISLEVSLSDIFSVYDLFSYFGYLPF